MRAQEVMRLTNEIYYQIRMPMSAFRSITAVFPGHFLLVVDENDRVRLWNTFAEMVLGVSAEKIEGMPLDRWVRGDWRIRDVYDRHFRRGCPVSSQPPLMLETANGPYAAERYAVFQVLTDEPSPWYMLLVHGFREHRGRSLLYRFADELLRHFSLGVLLIDAQFTLVDISDMACRILGLEREKVLNRPVDEVFAGIPEEHRLVRRSMLEGVVLRNHAVSWTNDEKRYELLLDSNLLRNERGEIEGAYVIFKDVTNLRSLEQQIQRSDRLAMIGQIAAGTAHEIRNPLTAIKGFLQMLNRSFRESGRDREREFTEIMLSEIDRINDLVSEFLLLSKPKDVVYTKIDVQAVIRDLLPIIRNEAILYDTVVEYRPAEAMPPVTADRELLKQVFLNICKNGIEAMGRGGTLTITERVDAKERLVHVDVHDTGPGIPPYLVDKIFDPFFTTKEQGTGLGLSVCQRIIHDIGGSIRVSSKGFGTTFTVSIPYDDDGQNGKG